MKGDMALAESFEVTQPGQAPGEREAAAAVAIAGGLYLVGAILCATALLLPHVDSPVGVFAVALDALLTAALLFYAAERSWGGLTLAFIADLWGVAIIGVLCASGGGAESPFALIYFFALGHAAAFQPRGRFVVVSAAGLIAFLLPLLYEAHVSTTFGAIACVGIVLALLTCTVVHLALNRMREQRRRLEILIAATAELDKSLDPGETLRTIAEMAVPGLAGLCVVDLLDESGAITSTVAAGVDVALAAELERTHASTALELSAEHPVARVLAGSASHLIHRPHDLPEAEGAALSDAGYVSAAIFPMVARGQTQGAISFWHRPGGAHYDRGLLAVLEDLTGRAAMALDNARLYAERAQVARTLRRSLMPAVLPVIPGLELASYFRPMSAGEEVGGDFYDVFGDREGCWLVVGDVCGKGAEAAALTGFLRHTTAAYAREGSSPAQVLAQVNRAMLEQDFDGRFATAIVAHLRFAAGGVDLRLAVAGHPAALLARADGQAGELGASGTLLGIFPDPAIDEVAARLAAGDSLTLYTDGLTEAHAPRRIVTVGELIERLGQLPPTGAQAAIDALLELIDLDVGVADDIAILSVRVARGASATPAERHAPALARRRVSARS
jgi:Stage II sporulation protein E (SpoIIE)/GAF domain